MCGLRWAHMRIQIKGGVRAKNMIEMLLELLTCLA